MFWQRFYDLCVGNGSKPNPIGKKLGIASGAISAWKAGTVPDREALVKIADHFDCSVDYLLGRTDNPQAHKNSSSVSVGSMQSNSGAIGVGNTVTNAAAPLDEQTEELLATYNKLSPLNKAKLLVYADELNK